MYTPKNIPEEGPGGNLEEGDNPGEDSLGEGSHLAGGNICIQNVSEPSPAY